MSAAWPTAPGVADRQDARRLARHPAADGSASDLLHALGLVASFLSGDRFEVKRLVVQPGRKISLQKHHHRSEHWIVVRGTAEVTIGEETRLLHENESIFVPLACCTGWKIQARFRWS